MQASVGRLRQANWILLVIIGLGLGLRLWGIGFGLPYLYHPDEGLPVAVALRMLQTGNLNPNFFDWPSLLFYVNALLYGGYFVVGRLLGWFVQPTDLAIPDVITIAVGKATVPGEFLLSRGFEAVVGAFSIVAVYWIGREIGRGRVAGWLAALWFAVETVDIRNSQFIRPDTLLIFFGLVSLYFSLRLLDDPSARNYILAGLAAGLAISSKYNAIFFVVPIAVSHFVRWRVAGLRRAEIYLAAIACGLAFLLTTPFAVLDWSHFWQNGILGDAAHYATGHAGDEGDNLAWYFGFLSGALNWMLPASLLEAILMLVTRERRAIVLLSFPVSYFIFINLYTVHFENTILPVIPFVILLAALLGGWLYRFVTSRWRVETLAYQSLFAGVAMILALPFLRASIEYNTAILQPDSRETARVWIEQNLPPDSRIFVEPYSPYVDPQRYVVEGAGATDHPLDWYVQNGFEYMVFSYGTYGRFFENRSLYSDTANLYEEFWARFPLVARFNDGGYEIKIYKTNVSDLPANRVSAHFGIFSNWLELVGYDLKPAAQGNPISAIFYWRVLEPRREPLTLTVRLLDRNDYEIKQSSGALFGNEHPTSGIVRMPWTINASDDPGLYRLELDVDAEGQGRIPVLSRTYGKISDKLFIDSFKVSPASISSDELQHALVSNGQFGDAIVLLGYSITNPNVNVCKNIETTIYWKSNKAIEKDYTVFMHLVDSSGKVVAQLDTQPRNGAYPTSIWDAGEVMSDIYTLALSCSIAPGDYRIELGMYEYPSLARLGVTRNGTDMGDHIILDPPIKVMP